MVSTKSVGNQYGLHNADTTIRARFIDYGATVTNLWCVDRHGQVGDVLLGCPTPQDYVKPHPHFNCLIGRYANRMTNAQFSLDGVQHQLEANIPPHQLHGGKQGFANRLWIGRRNGNTVQFELTSVDGDAGFPGEVKVVAIYTLEGHTLRLDMSATTTKPTPISLTAHHYFNLSTKQSSHIGDHELMINANKYLPVSNQLTQLGRIEDVLDTPFDFRSGTDLASRLQASHPQVQLADGIDHTFVIHGTGFREAATVYHRPSGRKLTVHTDQPAMQLYTCNTLDAAGKDGVRYAKHQGLCLETQQFPDAPNHRHYPSAILRPGEVWRGSTAYTFEVE